MIRILLGILIVGAAVSRVMGIGDRFVPIPLGLGGGAWLVALGLLLIGSGAYRRLRNRGTGDQHWLRTCGLMWSVLAALLLAAVAVHTLVGLFDVARVAGFPMGFYLAAQGSLVALVILAFLFALLQDRIDAENGASGETPHG